MPESLPPVTAWLREQMRLGKAKSLRQIARYARISPDTVKNIYDGTVSRPEPETITKLAKYFGIPRDDLMALAGYVEQRPRTLIALDAFKQTENMTPEELVAFRRQLDEAMREVDEIIARRRKGLPD